MSERTHLHQDPYDARYWWAVCDHGNSVWSVKHATKTLARRALAEHVTETHSGQGGAA